MRTETGFISHEKAWPGGEVTPSVFALRADNASPMTYTGTNTYLIGKPGGAGYIVDPGPAGQHEDDILSAVEARGLSVRGILLTHEHADHGESAATLAKRLGNIPILRASNGTLEDGPLERSLPGSGGWIHVSALPGHSDDSVGFFVMNDGVLLTGDVLFDYGPTAILFPEGDLDEYLDTLDEIEVLAKRGVKLLLPGHGWPIEDITRIVEATRRHRLSRLARIKEALDAGTEPTADAILAAVYADTPPALLPAARRGVQAQLRYLGFNPWD